MIAPYSIVPPAVPQVEIAEYGTQEKASMRQKYWSPKFGTNLARVGSPETMLTRVAIFANRPGAQISQVD